MLANKAPGGLDKKRDFWEDIVFHSAGFAVGRSQRNPRQTK
jgi:hypothetical protein